MTKNDIASEISLRTGVSCNVAAKIVSMTLDIIADSLAQGEPVTFRKFGKFDVQKIQARVGRNPRKPGTDLVIPAHNRVKFIAGNQLKDRVRKIK